MLYKLILSFLSPEKKLRFVEKNGVYVGNRNIPGFKSVVYLLGSMFIEISFSNDRIGNIKTYSSLTSFSSSTGNDFKQMYN